MTGPGSVRQMRRGRTRGAVLVEFALVAIVFFTALLSVIDMGTMFWVELTMQYAVREGARCAVTGASDCTGAAGNAGRNAGVIETIRLNSMGLYDYLSPTVTVSQVAADGSYQPVAAPPSPAPPSFGTGGQIIVIDVDCAWPLMTPLVAALFPNGKFTFRVAATMKNEAF
jgi:Flp pilus assembly protein TadG